MADSKNESPLGDSFHPKAEDWKGPPLQFAFRTRERVVLSSAPPHSAAPLVGFDNSAASESLTWSTDGDLLCILREEGVSILRASTEGRHSSESANAWEVIREIKRPDIKFVNFSPQGNYLLTWQRIVKGTDVPEEEDGVHGNVLLWRISTGQCLHGLTQKTFSREAWPLVKFTDDEKFAGIQVGNGVHIYTTEDGEVNFKSVFRKVALEHISKFEFSPSSAARRICVSSVEKKQQPARVIISSFDGTENKELASRSFFKAQSVNLLWNSKGTAVLVVSHTDVDTSGQSYYGETCLHFLCCQTTPGSAEAGFSQSVGLGKKGPIYDVSWSPKGNQFSVVYGSMPSKVSVFDAKCQKRADFPTAHRNVAKWSPNGSILMIGGFGSMPGKMEFWDVKRLAKVGVAQAQDSSVVGWSPCSNYFMTAIIFSRLKVDNGFKIWHWDGTAMHEEKFDEIHQVCWRPASAKFYPDFPPPRAASDRFKEWEKQNKDKPQVSSSGGKVEKGATGKYVPPSMRNRKGGPTIPGATPKALQVKEEAPRKYTPSQRAHNAPPGAAAVVGGVVGETGASGKKKRRKRGKKKTGGAADEDDEDNESNNNNSNGNGNSENNCSAGDGKNECQNASTGGDAPDKARRLKALNKKLRQISDLKDQQKNGKELNGAQREKIATEGDIRKQIEELQ